MVKQHCKRANRLILTVNFLRTHKKRKHDYANNKLHTSQPDDTTIWKQMLIITFQILNVGKGRDTCLPSETKQCVLSIILENYWGITLRGLFRDSIRRLCYICYIISLLGRFIKFNLYIECQFKVVASRFILNWSV